jgi:AcrR family transcriptional regulator
MTRQNECRWSRSDATFHRHNITLRTNTSLVKDEPILDIGAADGSKELRNARGGLRLAPSAHLSDTPGATEYTRAVSVLSMSGGGGACHRCGRPRFAYACVVPSRPGASAQTIDAPVRTRRGAAAVEKAISDAVLAELAEVGFGRLTFESVAERAGTGKSPLYRRWPDTTSLVIDTLERIGPAPSSYARTGVLRDDLIGLTRHMTLKLKDGKGDAFRSLLGEAHRYPQLLARFKLQVLDPMFESLSDLLRDAAARGEISAERLTPVVLEVHHALVIKRLLLDTHDPTNKEIAEMVDEVLLPLIVP